MCFVYHIILENFFFGIADVQWLHFPFPEGISHKWHITWIVDADFTLFLLPGFFRCKFCSKTSFNWSGDLMTRFCSLFQDYRSHLKYFLTGHKQVLNQNDNIIFGHICFVPSLFKIVSSFCCANLFDTCSVHKFKCIEIQLLTFVLLQFQQPSGEGTYFVIHAGEQCEHLRQMLCSFLPCF